jgi:hypothetical protein
MRSDKDVAELFKAIITDEKLNILQKKILLNEVRKLKSPDEDRWVYRTVVWVLGAVALGTVAYPFLCMAADGSREIPSGLLAIGSGAMGALAGYLTPNNTRARAEPELHASPPNDHPEPAPPTPPVE